jgi:predicted ArsR family transcriptional regulator
VDVSDRGKSSKLKILETIKRLNSPTLTRLSLEMGISKTAVLKHVEVMERKGILTRTYVSTGRGRPICKLSITEKAYDEMQNIYRNIAEEALSYVENNFGCSLIKEILAIRNGKLVEEYRVNLQNLPWEEMLRRFTELRNMEGYIAEISDSSDGSLRIIEYNCPLMKIAEKYHESCEAEKKFFEELFHMDVTFMNTVLENSRACTFVLKVK